MKGHKRLDMTKNLSPTKVCPECGEEKDRQTEFRNYKNNTSAYCIQCERNKGRKDYQSRIKERRKKNRREIVCKKCDKVFIVHTKQLQIYCPECRGVTKYCRPGGYAITEPGWFW